MKSAKEIAASYVLINNAINAVKGTEETTWGDTVLFTVPCVNGEGDCEKASKMAGEYLARTIEAEIRAQGETKMPGRYRSAKSVICKALSLGVALLDADGKPRGKTAVEKDCKEPQTPEEKLATLLARAVKIAGEDATPFNAEAIASLRMLVTLAK